MRSVSATWVAAGGAGAVSASTSTVSATRSGWCGCSWRRRCRLVSVRPTSQLMSPVAISWTRMASRPSTKRSSCRRSIACSADGGAGRAEVEACPLKRRRPARACARDLRRAPWRRQLWLRGREFERDFARPYEVPRVGLLELGIAAPGEAERLLRSLAPTPVDGDGRHQIEVMPGEAGEVAVDDLLQGGHPTTTPGLEVIRRKQAHADQNVDGCHDCAALENGRHRAGDPWVERILAVRRDADRQPSIRSLPHQTETIAITPS